MALFNIVSKIHNVISRGAGSLLSRYCSSDIIPMNREEESKKVIDAANELAAAKISRNFAIVHVMGKQFRVTDGDIIVLEGFWPPNIGDKMSLDKVLFAGSKDFSLIGMPLVQTGLVNVCATVIGKQMSYTKTHFKKKRRKQYMRIKFVQKEQTLLRINSVDIEPKLNNPTDVFNRF